MALLVGVKSFSRVIKGVKTQVKGRFYWKSNPIKTLTYCVSNR